MSAIINFNAETGEHLVMAVPPQAPSPIGNIGSDMQSTSGTEMASMGESSIVAVDLFDKFEPLPFDLSLMPSVVAAYAKDESEIAGIDPVAIAMPCLVACAAAIDDRIQIQVKRHVTNWLESARLWVAVLGPPSTMKTHGIGLALKTTKAISSAQIALNNEKEKEWRLECDNAKGDKLPPPDKPLIERATINDVTVERAAELISQCEPRGILLEKDELNGWLESMDAYKGKKGGDSSFWLEGYNGGSKSVDRMTRPTIDVAHIGVSVVGGIQDEVLRAYSNASNHDGMMQRMMIFPCRPRVKGEDRPNNQSFGDNYDRLIRGLYALPHYPGYTVKMADGAHRVREAFYEKLFALEEAIPNKFAKTTIGKWHGQFARMLLVYHCIDCYTENTHPLATPASESNAIKVAKLFMNVLLPATIKFYGQFDNAEDKARDIASLILAKGWTRFTEKRDLSINMKAYLGWKPWEQAEALSRLEAYGWIVPEKLRLNSAGRPTAYIVNEDVHTRFAAHAEKEQARRAAVTQMMNEINCGNKML
ncbi:MAG: DUF3987 domain-containing protein [Candidatus Accumulibacter phosphatis]|uniref:DUF3987 domain-containing protein n=1 Tax=Candidatus Accumulibacter phosphatis TaxID=327160 RepID=UPI001A53546F|nr:DUF3987 domain-containing protein [Candidatus Accumulibacter phosphatis]